MFVDCVPPVLNKMDVDCIQVNLRKSSLATSLFSHGLSSRIQLGFVAEPYTCFNKIVGKPLEYNVFPELPCSEVPRAAIYVPRNIKCIFLTHLSNPDCQVVLLQVQGKQVVVASIYLDILLPIENGWLDPIVEFANSKHAGVLLAMDSNAHSQMYGPSNNSRGDDLEHFILRHGLWVENRGTIPTFQTLQAESFIDVTLSRGIEIRDWKVGTQYNASDHNNIHFKLLFVEMIPPREIRAWGTAKWPMFTSELQKPGFSIPDVVTVEKLDKMVEYLYDRLDEALEIACPVIRIKQKFKGRSWFTDSLKLKQFKVRKQYDRAVRVLTNIKWDKYFSLHKKFKRLCRRAKTKSWRQFVSETENEHKMSRLPRISLHKDKTQIHTFERPDGSMTEPGSETLQELARVHFPAATTPSESEPEHRETSLRKEEIDSIYGEFLTPKIVEAVQAYESSRS